MKFLAIVMQGLFAAVLFGIVHDQVTIRICPEYFTVAHPRVSDTKSLTLLALIWGVIATWWVGLPLGILLAIAARVGRLPKAEPRQTLRWITRLLIVMACCAILAGLAAWGLGLGSTFRNIGGDLAHRIDERMHDRFMIAYSMHLTSYLVGAVGGVVLALYVIAWRWRKQADASVSDPLSS